MVVGKKYRTYRLADKRDKSFWPRLMHANNSEVTEYDGDT